MLFLALLHAADRRVRVRLLLDDNNTAGMDQTLAVLDSHPNIEVRLFNPFVIRNPRWIGYLSDSCSVSAADPKRTFTAQRLPRRPTLTGSHGGESRVHHTRSA